MLGAEQGRRDRPPSDRARVTRAPLSVFPAKKVIFPAKTAETVVGARAWSAVSVPCAAMVLAEEHPVMRRGWLKNIPSATPTGWRRRTGTCKGPRRVRRMSPRGISLVACVCIMCACIMCVYTAGLHSTRKGCIHISSCTPAPRRTHIFVPHICVPPGKPAARQESPANPRRDAASPVCTDGWMDGWMCVCLTIHTSIHTYICTYTIYRYTDIQIHTCIIYTYTNYRIHGPHRTQRY